MTDSLQAAPEPALVGLSPEGERLVRAFAPGLGGPSAGECLTGLAAVLMARGLRADAALVCRHATAVAGDAETLARARLVASSGVPDWHPHLLGDRVRADLYDRAIRRAVVPGSLVLDIGTGSGLLAMMAARAGAGLVVACERDPVLARAAAEIVDRNGLADRIRVVACSSADLVVGDDLPRRADLVISEIVSNDLLGEQVLPTMAAARRDLLDEAAPAIPGRGAIHAALVELTDERRGPIRDLAGFDLSPFNTVTPPFRKVGSWSRVPRLSAGVELFSFDLSGRVPVRPGRVARGVRVERAGRLSGVVQWMSLDLGGGLRLDTGPDEVSPPTAWTAQVHLLDDPVDVVEGQTVTVEAWHGEHELLVWAAC